MIRNVVLGRIAPDADDAVQQRIDGALTGIAGLSYPGLLAMTLGRDAGLRAGGWSFAIVNDWADEASYRVYDLDPEHNRYRAVIVAECAEVARVQFLLDAPTTT